MVKQAHVLFYHKLKEDLRGQGISQKRISNILGVSESMVSQYLSGTKEMTAEQFVKIIEYSFKTNARRFERQLSGYLNIVNRVKDFYVMYEYLAIGYRYSMILELVDQELIKTGEVIIGSVYQLMIQRAKRDISKQKFLSEVMRLKEETVHAQNDRRLEALHSICEVYAMHDMASTEFVLIMLQNMEQKFLKLDNDFVKISYLNRVKELRMQALLLNDNVQEAALVANELIGNSDKFITTAINAAVVLSEIHFDSYHEAIKWLDYASGKLEAAPIEKSLSIRTIIKQTKEFVCIYNERFSELVFDELSDPEKVHFLAKTGQKERALKLLEGFNELTAFQKYYKYLATNEDNDRSNAIISFSIKGNLFYLNKLLLKGE